MFSVDHRDTWRRWPLFLLALGALALVLASRAGGAPAPDISVQVDDPPPIAPFPMSATMTDTIASALAAFDQALIEPVAIDQATIDQATPPPCKPFNRRVFLPCIRGTGTTATPVKRADVALTIWPTPSICVARGGNLSVELRLKNFGRLGADQIQVTLPYTKQQMTLIGSQFTRPGDWISELTDDRIVVTFGSLSADNFRAATLIFRVGGALPNNTVISLRGSYRWTDARGSRDAVSNWAPVLVGGGSETATWTWLEVKPVSGVAGTTFHFFTDRLIPGEGVIVWLNTPNGERATSLRAIADGYGRACVDFNSAGLPPGTYSFVLYGARSDLTAIARFYVL